MDVVKNDPKLFDNFCHWEAAGSIATLLKNEWLLHPKEYETNAVQPQRLGHQKQLRSFEMLPPWICPFGTLPRNQPPCCGKPGLHGEDTCIPFDQQSQWSPSFPAQEWESTSLQMIPRWSPKHGRTQARPSLLFSGKNLDPPNPWA